MQRTYKDFLENLETREKEISNKIKDDKHYCYVIKCNDNTLYTGYAKDPIKRLYEHNFLESGAKYTKTRRPVHLLEVFEFDDRSSAMKYEYFVKHLKREDKLKLFEN